MNSLTDEKERVKQSVNEMVKNKNLTAKKNKIKKKVEHEM
jgi:hypothetical protein